MSKAAPETKSQQCDRDPALRGLVPRGYTAKPHRTALSHVVIQWWDEAWREVSGCIYRRKASALYTTLLGFSVWKGDGYFTKKDVYIQVLGCVLSQASQKFQVFPPSKLRRLQQHLSTNILDMSSVLLSHTSLYKQRWKLWRQEKAFCMASKVCVISGILWVETKICLTYLSGLIVSLWKRKPTQLLQL